MDIVYTINCSYFGFLAEEKKIHDGIVGNVLCQMDNVVIVNEGISRIYTLSCCLAENSENRGVCSTFVGLIH